MKFEDAVVFMFRAAAIESDDQLKHFLRVGLEARKISEEAGIVGILHDLIEDDYTSDAGLEEAGCPRHLINVVHELTRMAPFNYEVYIATIVSGSELAKAIKRIDIRDNLARKPKSAHHTARYMKALESLA